MSVGDDDAGPGDPGDPGDPPPDPPPPFDEGCSVLFHQTTFPEYRITVSNEDWAALTDEFLHRAERQDAGLPIHPYHPIGFEYRGDSVPDVMIRLKGQSSWWDTIQNDANPKMQFVIAFNEVDHDARFKGVRKLELDMPRSDGSFLRQRMGLYFMRRANIPAQCANSARLFINGEYYGLYTNLEHLDKEFLQRVFPGPDEDEGDLWKSGRFIETNEDTFSWDRLMRFWHPASLSSLEQITDLDASIAEWAAEAMLPHADGVYAGRANFFLYDHPTRGFIWLPYDLDSVLDFFPTDASPLYPEGIGRFADDREHWNLVLSDPRWVRAFVDDLRAARDAYRVAELRDKLVTWSQQIAMAATTDPHGAGAFFDIAVDSIYDYFGARAAAVDAWLDCRDDGGVDSDGDGYAWCFECDDDNRATHPGATERCNGIDDNCDGLIDDADRVTSCAVASGP